MVSLTFLKFFPNADSNSPPPSTTFSCLKTLLNLSISFRTLVIILLCKYFTLPGTEITTLRIDYPVPTFEHDSYKHCLSPKCSNSLGDLFNSELSPFNNFAFHYFLSFSFELWMLLYALNNSRNYVGDYLTCRPNTNEISLKTFKDTLETINTSWSCLHAMKLSSSISLKTLVVRINNGFSNLIWLWFFSGI